MKIVKCSNANCQFGNKIDLNKDKYIHFSNYEGKKLKEEFYFHHFCWGNFIQEQINKGINQIMQRTMQNVAPMIERIKGII